MSYNKNKTINALIMYVLPFIVESVYLYASRASGKQTANSDTLGIISSVILGSIPLYRTRMKLLPRFFALVAYNVGLVSMLTLFSFVFVCVVLRDCL